MNNKSLAVLAKKYPLKRAFISGAASGLGLALATILLNDGWRIGVTDINEENLKKTFSVSENVFLYYFDVSNPDLYKISIDDYLNKVGGVDLVFNNAGVGDGEVFEEYSLENYQWMNNINQMGVLYGCYFFIPTLKKQNSGVLINVASAAGFANLPKMASYNITKAAVIALSETLCVELKKYGIQVTVVTPTFFQSNILSQAKGAEKIVNVAQKFINNSSLTETDAAWKVLKGVSKGTFQLIFPLSAKLIWYIKRLSPSFYRLIAYKLFN